MSRKESENSLFAKTYSSGRGTMPTAPPAGYPYVPPNTPRPVSTNVNLQVDPQVLAALVRIAVALEGIVEKMGSGFE